MKHKAYAYVAIATTLVFIGAPNVRDRATGASTPHVPIDAPVAAAADIIDARRQADIAVMERFRPGFAFWQNIFTIPDGYVVFGRASDGRALAVFPTGGDWSRNAKWLDRSLAGLLRGRDLPHSLDDRREFVARLLEQEVGPVLHNETRGSFASPGINRYGTFFRDWSTIYARFGVPAEIGLAQAMLESGFQGDRRSEADAVGLCQWLERNWEHLDRIDPSVIESGNQTTQAAYCAAYLSVLATKYASFIPALSAHHAGGTNVGRILVSGQRLGGEDTRERYMLGAEFARGLRSLAHEQYSDIYQSYGPRSYRYAEIVFGNMAVISNVVADTPQTPIYAMRTTRSIDLAEIARRTGLSVDEIQRCNPALKKRVPDGATLYLPVYDRAFGEDVSFWRREAPAAYVAVLDDFVRLHATTDQWDDAGFERTLRDFERRFRATRTEEGTVMATVLAYVRGETFASPRRQILADFEASQDIRYLFERGVHDLDAASAVAAE